MLRVLRVHTDCARGGAAVTVKALHHGVSKNPGHEDFFAYGRGPRRCESSAKRIGIWPEVYLHAFITRATGLQGYGSLFSTRRLLSVVRNWRPDIVHFHNLHGYYLNIAVAKELRKLGKPIVWTLHDAWALTGRCAYFFDCDRWRTGCGKCPYPREYPKTYFDSSSWMWRKKRELLGEVWNPVIVTPSQWLAELVSEATTGRCRIEVVPNGIDTGLFRPRDRAQIRRKLGLPTNKKVILFTAVDLKDERKGARYFFESLDYVKADRWMAVTVGKPGVIPGASRERVDIRQLGYMSDTETMAEVYSAADVFCITSLDEVFGKVVTEAMASGIPVVGFHVGGIPEQVVEGCGRLVPPRDAKGLGEAITELLRDDKLCKEMGRHCRERAVKEYDVGRFTERYLALYHELVEGR